jgi:methylthioribose-1-phosphate isomerase
LPFYVALPSPTVDFSIDDGIRQIPIEQRSADEVATMTGRTAEGRIETIRIVSEGSPVANYGFDITPARLVTGLITERGGAAGRPRRARRHVSGAGEGRVRGLGEPNSFCVSAPTVQKTHQPLPIT